MNPIRRAQLLLSTFLRRARPLLSPSSIYSRAVPAPQEAINMFRGEWTSRLPGYDSGGTATLFEGDERPAWMARAAGGVDGKRILELGPLEGGHTYQLERLGARVTALESNSLAFQRCLVVKNLYDLRSTFLLGDFVSYLESSAESYDIVFASGVLYHMRTPVRVIENMCRMADQVFLWTHYYDATVQAGLPVLARSFSSAATKTETLKGQSITSHERRYNSGWLTYFQPGFCGGMDVSTYWLTLADLKRCFEILGFDVVGCETAVSDHGAHVNLMARRRVRA
jgi:hypothetical protein